MEDPLAVLERAERWARERRLAALAEADRISAEAAARVAAIEAERPARIEARLAELRAAYARATAEQVAAVETDPLDRGAAAVPADPARIAEAAEVLVRAVLGEVDGCG
jgi:adenosylmethionine-8-amino-7-oxononanoate aminotransferase